MLTLPLLRVVAAIVAVFAFAVPTSGADAPLVKSKQSGAWSAKETWDGGRVPKTGDRVVIRAGHNVGYDVVYPPERLSALNAEIGG